MPFYTPSNEIHHDIDFNRYKPVSVIAHYDVDGNIKPMRFKYSYDDVPTRTIDINSVVYSKEVRGGILFSCLVDNHCKQQQITLIFYVMKHIWVIDMG